MCACGERGMAGGGVVESRGGRVQARLGGGWGVLGAACRGGIVGERVDGWWVFVGLVCVSWYRKGVFGVMVVGIIEVDDGDVAFWW